MRNIPDFYMEIEWKIESWLPFVSSMAPRDTFKIWKKQDMLRFDSTLRGMTGREVQRGLMSFLFTGQSIYLVDHDNRHWSDALAYFRNPSYSRIRREVQSMMRDTSRGLPQMNSNDVVIERRRTFFGGLAKEKVGRYMCKQYELQGLAFSVVKPASEHVSSESRRDNMPEFDAYFDYVRPTKKKKQPVQKNNKSSSSDERQVKQKSQKSGGYAALNDDDDDAEEEEEDEEDDGDDGQQADAADGDAAAAKQQSGNKKKKNNNNNKDNNKPKTSLRYVLFAVLMHSGTAMGGHYFAYIRGAHDRQWYEFNDAIVSRLDREDPLKYAYGSEKSGMNAYMLMYRRATDAEYEQARQQQLDRERRLKESRSASSVAATDDSKENKSIINNTASLSSASNSSSSSGDASPSLEAKEDADADDNNSNHNDDDDDDGECKTKSKQSGRHAHMFSELIADDLRAMVDREDGEYEEKLREAERLRRLLDLCVVYNSKETRFQMDMGVTVGEASERIRQDLGLADKFAPEQLRLRFFSKQIGFAQATLEGMEKVSLQDAGFTRSNTLLLETRAPDEEFPPYNPNEIPVRVKVVSQNNIDAVVEDSAYPLHPDAFQADDVVTVHVDVVEQSVDDIARAVANAAEQLDVEAVRLVRITDDKSVQILSRDTKLSDTNIEAGIMLYCEDVRQDDAVRRYVDDKIAALLAQDDATPSSTAGGDATVSAASAALPPAIKQSPLVALFEFTQCLVKIEFNDPRPLPSSISSSSNDGDEEAKQPDAMDGAVRFSMSTRLSKNSEMRVLKEQIGAHLRLPVDEFRIKTSQVGKEFKDLSKTLGEAKLTQGSVVFVELGTPLGPNESLVKFFLYRPQRKKMQFKTLEIPVDRMMLIKDVKQLVVDKINAQFPPKKKEQQEDDSSKTDRNNDSSATDGAQQQEQEPTKNKPQRKNRFGIEHVRLRERLRQKVGKIYSDTMTLGRSIPRLKDGTQIAVQQVAVPEVVTHQHRPIFIQRWHPDTRVLDDKVEVLVRRNGPVSELKDEIVKQSSPPIERANVGVARGSTYASSNMKPEQVEKKNFKDKRVVDTGLMKMAPLRLRDGDLVLYQDNSKVPERKTGDGDAGGAGSGSGSGSGSDAASRRNRMSKYGRVSRRGRKSGVKVSMHHKSRKARPEFGLRIRTPEDVRREQEELERALAASRESAAQEQQRRDNNNNNNTNNSES
eukprot:TRINITY_DN66192_c8_g1_i1.p1 TRINITY_DN66192_c8_g1~~TRINITY_DN66192_c8_g1_i1.p1  ORF type:complete len:1255 (+),score=711.83 TRINITY_DN66192_c8_g1_i1:159-3767(+)